jgi:hypothetical protein
VTRARPGRAGAIAPRTTPPPRRGHTTVARLIGAIGLVLLTAVLFWLLTDDTFRVSEESVGFQGLVHADEAAVRDKLSDLERGPNVFRVRASDIVSELSTLTEVDAAYARVTLPAEVTVGLDERDPVFIWSNRAVSWLVDEEGMLFAPADESTAQALAHGRTALEGESEGTGEEVAQEAAGSGSQDDAGTTTLDPALTAREALPTVQDTRNWSEPPTVGTYLRSADLAVMRLLLALTPELLGVKPQQLTLHVDTDDGYLLKSDRGWRALFGHYNPTVQPPDIIPAQVQCLQWVLASQERKLEQVRLALSDEACGTWTTFE